MCCSGFLKLMMFVFNGGIFVSWNEENYKFSVSAVQLYVGLVPQEKRQDSIHCTHYNVSKNANYCSYSLCLCKKSPLQSKLEKTPAPELLLT